MDAITLLKQQHSEVDELFEEFEDCGDDYEKQSIFGEIADSLAIHTSIEERYFYPTVQAKQTEEQLEEAFDEHIEIKKLLLDAFVIG